jgi:lamin tail-like protein
MLLQGRATLRIIRAVQRTQHRTRIMYWLAIGLLAVMPIVPVAADAIATPQVLAPLLITEVQAGSAASASEEFIELTNTTDQPIDLAAHGWRLDLAATTANDWSNPLRSISLSGTVAAGQRYIIASQFTSGSQAIRYLPDKAGIWFTAGISAAAGHVRLVFSTNQPQSDGTCSASDTVVDEVEWSAPKNGAPATPSLDGRTVFLTSKSTGIPAGSSIQRYAAPGGEGFIDTDSDASDFYLSSQPTPGIPGEETPAIPSAPPQSAVPLPIDTCSPNPVVAPGAGDTGGGETDPAPVSVPNNGLIPPQISELLPNPAPPQTDAADEYIELYNPNDASFALDGYVLQAGLTTLHTYTFPADAALAPHAYAAFFAADTGLSLSNSSGQVALLDPSGTVLATADPYGSAKEGQAWAFIDGSWQWTASPTPDQSNVRTLPPVTTKTPAATKTPKVKAASTAKPAAKTAKAKSTAKASKAAKPKAAKPKPAATQEVATTVPSAGQNLNLLVVIGVIAVLYGAYEYRHDVANKYRLFREYRATRRKGRPGT